MVEYYWGLLRTVIACCLCNTKDNNCNLEDCFLRSDLTVHTTRYTTLIFSSDSLFFLMSTTNSNLILMTVTTIFHLSSKWLRLQQRDFSNCRVSVQVMFLPTHTRLGPRRHVTLFFAKIPFPRNVQKPPTLEIVEMLFIRSYTTAADYKNEAKDFHWQRTTAMPDSCEPEFRGRGWHAQQVKRVATHCNLQSNKASAMFTWSSLPPKEQRVLRDGHVNGP